MNTQYLHELKQPGIKFTDPANTEVSRREIKAYFKQLELLRLDFIEHISSCRESVALAYFDTMIDIRKMLLCYPKHASGQAGKVLRDWLDVFPSSVVNNPTLMAQIVSGYSKSIEITLDFLHTVSPAEAFHIKEEHKVVHKEDTVPKPVFFEELQVPQETLPAIFSALKQEHWIANDTSEDVFMFYFTGRGEATSKAIRWTEKIRLLALFINEITADKSRWNKASKIFETRVKGKLNEYSTKSPNNYTSSLVGATESETLKANESAVKRVVHIK